MKSPGAVAGTVAAALGKPAGQNTIAKTPASGSISKSPVPGKAPATGTLPKAAGVAAPAKAAVAKPPAAGVLPKVSVAVASLAKVTAPGVPPGVKGQTVGTVAKSSGSANITKAPVSTSMKALGTGLVKAKVAGLATKAGLPVAAQATAVAPAKSPPTTDGASPLSVAKAQDGGLSQVAVSELVSTIESAPGSAKIRSVVRLADAMGQNLQIEHINHFLRALKKKVIERAQRDGVRVPVTKASSAVTKVSPVLAQTTTPKPAAPVAGTPAATPVASAAAATDTVPVTAGKQVGAAKASSVASGQAQAKPPATARPKPPQPPPQPQADQSNDHQSAPPPSPPPADPSEDPLYILLGELTANPVYSDGALNEARLGEVLKRLWDGAARKPKDWIVAWQAMKIVVEKQGEALQKFLNMAFMQTTDPERAAMVMAELVKAHKVKMRSVEEVLVAFGHNLDGILAINEHAWHIYAQFLVHVFPKPAASGWGWSRVGWSWQSWWKFTEQCIQSLEPFRASDVLCTILRLIQERECQPLGEIAAWTEGDKLNRIVTKLSELGSCDSAEALEKLSTHGVVVDV